MNNGEKTACLLCGAQAERSPYSIETGPPQTEGGWKYLCPNCGPYALPDNEHHWVEHFCSPDQRIMIFEYLRDNPGDEGQYKVLTMEEIEKVLGGPTSGEQ